MLAKPSVPALGWLPTTSVLQIQARRCSNWQNWAFLPLADHPPLRFLLLADHPPISHLSSANSSTQVLELAKQSVPALGWLLLASILQIRACECLNWQNRVSPLLSDHPLTSVLPIRAVACSNWQNWVFPLLANHPHLGSANSSVQVLELAKLNLSLPKHPLVFANSSAQVLELAVSSLLCLLDCPPPSFLPIWALALVRSNWQNWAHLVLTLVHTLSPSFCGFQHLYAWTHRTVSLDFS